MLNKYGIGGFLFAALLGACASTGTNGGENGTGEDGCASRCTSFGWEECLGEGEFAAPVSCADDEICIADSGCGVCVPGARYCGGEDEQDMFLCSDDGAGGEKVGRCEGDEVCSNGFCAATCERGLSDCGGNCVNVLNDRRHCGACGTLCGPSGLPLRGRDSPSV